MRSRYVAFVLGLESYLLKTWHPSYRPESITFDPQQKWLGLKVKTTVAGQATDDRGEVEFIARYKQSGKAYRLHERSQFIRHHGAWLYRHGEILDT